MRVRRGAWQRLRLDRPDPSPVVGAVRLRAPEDRDVDPVLTACRDPQVRRYTRIPEPYDARDAHAFVHEAARRRDAGLSLEMVATDRPDGALCGVVGIVVDRYDPARAEIGYWTHPDHRGRGVARAALAGLARWCLTEAGFVRLDLTASVSNRGSLTVARAGGFREEGTLRAAWPTPEGREDMAMMSLVSGDLADMDRSVAPAA